MSFNDGGVNKHLEVARCFEDPFINDYWYLINKAGAEPLESIATLGESVGMKVVSLGKDAGTFPCTVNLFSFFSFHLKQGDARKS